MPKDLRIIAVLTLFAIWSVFLACRVSAQNRPAVSELIGKLQMDETSNQARNQLLRLGKSDPEVRRYLVGQLPQIVAIGPKPKSEGSVHQFPCCRAWSNAVDLAGKLKIHEAAPALAQWIDVRTSGPLAVGLGPQLRLDTMPAAKALIEIGTPAIPVVQRVFHNGNPIQHEIAVRVLCMMNSPEAKAALRDDLPQEQNPHLRAEIERELNRK